MDSYHSGAGANVPSPADSAVVFYLFLSSLT